MNIFQTLALDLTLRHLTQSCCSLYWKMRMTPTCGVDKFRHRFGVCSWLLRSFIYLGRFGAFSLKLFTLISLLPPTWLLTWRALFLWTLPLGGSAKTTHHFIKLLTCIYNYLWLKTSPLIFFLNSINSEKFQFSLPS